MPHLSPTTLTTDDQRLILRVTAVTSRAFCRRSATCRLCIQRRRAAHTRESQRRRGSHGHVVVTRGAPGAPCAPWVPNVPLPQAFPPRTKYQNPVLGAGAVASTSVTLARLSKHTSPPATEPTGNDAVLPRTTSYCVASAAADHVYVALSEAAATPWVSSGVVIVVPAQTPPAQASPTVQPLPSLHSVPFAAAGLEQVPVAGAHVPATWHWSLAVHTTGLEPRHVPF